MAEFFAACAAGTEGALARELEALGLDRVRRGRGGVTFTGYQEDGWLACIHSRIATRMQMVLGRFPVRNAKELYEGVREIDWESALTPEHTLAVTALGTTDTLHHTGYTALQTKDAIVDRLRERFGARPSVDAVDPDVSIIVHLSHGGATVYADMAGESLHRRGYRVDGGAAPLRETLAAACLAMAGYVGRRPFHDPFCGSGTLPVEAALIAWNIAPGLLRERFGFERWASHDRFAVKTVAEMREEARMAIRRDQNAVPPIYGSDVDRAAVQRTEEAALKASIPLRVRVMDAREISPLSPPGVIVSNPPWGERLARDEALLGEVCGVLSGLVGHTVALISGEDEAPPALSAAPRSTFKLRSGPINGKLVVWDL